MPKLSDVFTEKKDAPEGIFTKVRKALLGKKPVVQDDEPEKKDESTEPTHRSCDHDGKHLLYRDHDVDAFEPLRPGMTEDAKLKPELERLVQNYAKRLVQSGGDQTKISRILHQFVVDSERAEGEDPSEVQEGRKDEGPRLGGRDDMSRMMAAHALDSAPFKNRPQAPATRPNPPMSPQDHARRADAYADFMPQGKKWEGKLAEELPADKRAKEREKLAQWLQSHKPSPMKPKPEREPRRPSNPVDVSKYGAGHLWDPRGTEDVVQDYPQGEAHPLPKHQRSQLKTTLDHIASGLEKAAGKTAERPHGVPQILRAVEWLKKAADIPAERLPGELGKVHDILHRAKKDLKNLPGGEAQVKAVEDALLGMPTALKLAANVGKTVRPSSEKELWKTKMAMRPVTNPKEPKGRQGSMSTGGTATDFALRKNPETGEYMKLHYPTGPQPEKEKPGTKGASAVQQRIQPKVRRQDPEVMKRIQPQVRKKQEG